MAHPDHAAIILFGHSIPWHETERGNRWFYNGLNYSPITLELAINASGRAVILHANELKVFHGVIMVKSAHILLVKARSE